nr:hypothetical protein [Chitinophaga pinensis]
MKGIIIKPDSAAEMEVLLYEEAHNEQVAGEECAQQDKSVFPFLNEGSDSTSRSKSGIACVFRRLKRYPVAATSKNSKPAILSPFSEGFDNSSVAHVRESIDMTKAIAAGISGNLLWDLISFSR